MYGYDTGLISICHDIDKNVFRAFVTGYKCDEIVATNNIFMGEIV
jgi:hypothetical protein